MTAAERHSIAALRTAGPSGTRPPADHDRERLQTSACEEDGGRYELDLRGRVLFDRSSEHSCTLGLVDGTSARLAVDGPVDLGGGGHAVAYIDLIGRVEGKFLPLDHRTIVLSLIAPETKRRRLMRQFRLIAHTPPTGLVDLRADLRVAPADPHIVLSLADGANMTASILNYSRSGAALATHAAVSIDDLVTLGRTRARVVRTFDAGFAVQFLRLLPWESFNADFAL